MSEQAYKNTNKEIWRGKSHAEFGDDDRFYADSLFIPEGDIEALGINCGGFVIVKPIREWHRLGSGADYRHDVIRNLEGPAARTVPSDALRLLSHAEGRLFQFRRMKHDRPIDPIYWDAHEERELEAEICSLAAAPPSPALRELRELSEKWRKPTSSASETRHRRKCADELDAALDALAPDVTGKVQP